MKLIYLVSMLFTIAMYIMTNTLTTSIAKIHYTLNNHNVNSYTENNTVRHMISTIAEFIAKLLIAFYICLILLFFYILIEIVYRREIKRSVKEYSVKRITTRRNNHIASAIASAIVTYHLLQHLNTTADNNKK